jgi:hypothetical protein
MLIIEMANIRNCNNSNIENNNGGTTRISTHRHPSTDSGASASYARTNASDHAANHGHHASYSASSAATAAKG